MVEINFPRLGGNKLISVNALRNLLNLIYVSE